jgi:hypothetical protein
MIISNLAHAVSRKTCREKDINCATLTATQFASIIPNKKEELIKKNVFQEISLCRFSCMEAAISHHKLRLVPINNQREREIIIIVINSS